jgi:hypothetical protein
MSEYGIPREQALYRYPLATALALMPAAQEQAGREMSGPSGEDLAFIDAMKS